MDKWINGDKSVILTKDKWVNGDKSVILTKSVS